MTTITRREFLAASAGAAAISLVGWPREFAKPAAETRSAGELAHLIPTASHERLLLKASFKKPLGAAPRLAIDGRLVPGGQADPLGRFWRFDVASLQPATRYELQLTDAGGAPLCDACSPCSCTRYLRAPRADRQSSPCKRACGSVLPRIA
jgi:hypothetical protein